MIKRYQLVLNDQYADHKTILNAIDSGAYNVSEQLRQLMLDGVKWRNSNQAQVPAGANVVVQEKPKPVSDKPKRKGFIA